LGELTLLPFISVKSKSELVWSHFKQNQVW